MHQVRRFEKESGRFGSQLLSEDDARRIAANGSNPALGLNASQPPNQRYSDNSDEQNRKLHLAFFCGS